MAGAGSLERGRRRGLATCLLYITFQPPAGVKGENSEVGEVIPARFGLSARITYCSPNHPSFLVAEGTVGSVSPSPKPVKVLRNSNAFHSLNSKAPVDR